MEGSALLFWEKLFATTGVGCRVVTDTSTAGSGVREYSTSTTYLTNKKELLNFRLTCLRKGLYRLSGTACHLDVSNHFSVGLTFDKTYQFCQALEKTYPSHWAESRSDGAQCEIYFLTTSPQYNGVMPSQNCNEFTVFT